MTWIFDQPIYIALIGLALGFLAGVLWTSTGRREFLAALGAVIVLTVGLLIVERVVVTDQEAIRQTLAEIARDVQTNEVAKVIRHITPGKTEMVAKAQAEMPNYRFTECRVTKVHKTEVNPTTEPRTAVVEFNVVVSGSFREGGLEASGTYPRWVRLHLVKEKDGRWTVHDYEHAPPQQMMFKEPLESGMGR